MTERAWTNQQASREAQWLSSHQGGQILANRAWALAKLGRHQEADETRARAFNEYDRSFKLSAASMHWRAEHVMRLCGDHGAAREHLARTLEIDPNGNYGRLAQQSLAEQGRLTEPDS